MLGFILILSILFHTTNFNNQLLIGSLCTICVIVLRLTPTINRTQGSLYSINSYRPIASELIEFDKKFNSIETILTEEKLPFNSCMELRNVSFNYENEIGLKNINLTINKNDFIHIIGKSGSYKTTLALILTGLIEPKSGKLLIDNNEIKEYKKWCNNIAFLSQDFTFLFEKVSEILNFNFDITKELSNKLDIEKLKDKTVFELSSGEKQRVALADILLKDKM